jgi:hypothetical protein
MQPLLVVIALDELFDVAPQVLQVLVLVRVNFFSLQGLDKAFTTGIGEGRPPQRMAT